jgi:16S rRNA (uracil1498-N3)-methyltransferase
MRLHRFYIEQKLEKGKEIKIENFELIHQWVKVFRLSSSDRVVMFNGNGSDFEGYFKILTKNEAILVIDKERKIKNTPSFELHIFQSIIKKDNFELVVEKCTEIGAAAYHPVLAERSEKKDLNIERLRKIGTEAAEQSGRAHIPEIYEPVSLESAIENFDGQIFALDFDGEEFKSIKKTKGKKIGILIGPEGGWTENERDLFEHKNIKTFSLGSQILRAETAAIVASALLLN